MKKAILAATLGLAMASGAAMAQDVSSPSNYTFVEGGYSHMNLDDTSIDIRGAYLRGSYEFNDSGFYVFGRAQRGEIESTDFHLNEYEAGVGYHRALGDRVDGFAELSAERLDGPFGLESNGYRAGVGVKYAMTDRFEGLAQVNYRDGRDYVGDTTGVLGVKYAFTPKWSMVGNVEFDGDGQLYNVGARYSF